MSEKPTLGELFDSKTEGEKLMDSAQKLANAHWDFTVDAMLRFEDIMSDKAFTLEELLVQMEWAFKGAFKHGYKHGINDTINK